MIAGVADTHAALWYLYWRSPRPGAAAVTVFSEKEPKLWKSISPPNSKRSWRLSAAQQGRNPDELVQDVVSRYFEEEARFVEAVKRGEEALQSGEHLTHEQVGERLQRFLQP